MVIVESEWETIRDDGSQGYGCCATGSDREDRSEPDDLVVDAAREVDVSLLD